MDTQMRKGMLEACVLVAVENGESYGYRIIEDIRPVVDISESTLYPILKRLEQNGYLTIRSKEYNGRLRKYYMITTLGRGRLAEYRNILKDMDRLHRYILRGEK